MAQHPDAAVGLQFLQPFGHLPALPVPGRVQLVLQLIDPLLAGRAKALRIRAKRRWERRAGQSAPGRASAGSGTRGQATVQLFQPLLHLVLRLGE